jgi:hypothetical protein
MLWLPTEGNHDAHRILHHACRRRRTITIELPEFAIRAQEHRVEMTNAGEDDEEMVSFNLSTRWRSLRAG